MTSRQKTGDVTPAPKLTPRTYVDPKGRRLVAFERPGRLPKITEATWRAAKALYDAHKLLLELAWGEDCALSYTSLSSAASLLQCLLTVDSTPALRRRVARTVLSELRAAETLARKVQRQRRLRRAA